MGLKRNGKMGLKYTDGGFLNKKQEDKKMTKTISVFNQKGGVGKTTTLINLAYELSNDGKKVLIIDADPQANATTGLNMPKAEPKEDIGHLITKGGKGIKKTPYSNLDIIPASQNITNSEAVLIASSNRGFELLEYIETIKQDYDIIMIDIPPTINVMTVNALIASNHCVVPTEVNKFAIDGLASIYVLMDSIRTLNDIELHVLVTRYSKNKYNQKTLQAIKDNLPECLETIIRHSDAIQTAQNKSVPVSEYMAGCNGTIDYKSLKEEVAKKWKL
jgi:chromosome partitioning protein